MMDEACNQLVKSGNWQRVGSSDIKLFLDMYVQALLLKMAQTTDVYKRQKYSSHKEMIEAINTLDFVYYAEEID